MVCFHCIENSLHAFVVVEASYSEQRVGREENGYRRWIGCDHRNTSTGFVIQP